LEGEVVKKYLADLDEHERNELERLTTKDNSGTRKIRRARLLLPAHEGRLDKEVASFLGSAVTTVERVRKRFVEEGLEAALPEKPRPAAVRNLHGRPEAFLMESWLAPTSKCARGKSRAVGSPGSLLHI
jgi:hypothetical protein